MKPHEWVHRWQNWGTKKLTPMLALQLGSGRAGIWTPPSSSSPSTLGAESTKKRSQRDSAWLKVSDKASGRSHPGKALTHPRPSRPWAAQTPGPGPLSDTASGLSRKLAIPLHFQDSKCAPKSREIDVRTYTSIFVYRRDYSQNNCSYYKR